MGVRWRRGTGDICGVLLTSAELSGMSGGRVPGEVQQFGTTQKSFYVLAWEGKNCDPKGGPNASPMVQPLWGAHANGEVVGAQTDVHIHVYLP